MELDEKMVEEAFDRGEPMVYLRHLPKGVWVRMKKYTNAPFLKELKSHDDTLVPAETRNLIFVEVRTSDQFHFRNYSVTRTALPLSHGRVVTATACQGRTMGQGGLIDCGRLESGPHPEDDDDWWLDLYVGRFTNSPCSKCY